MNNGEYIIALRLSRSTWFDVIKMKYSKIKIIVRLSGKLEANNVSVARNSIVRLLSFRVIIYDDDPMNFFILRDNSRSSAVSPSSSHAHTYWNRLKISDNNRTPSRQMGKKQK